MRGSLRLAVAFLFGAFAWVVYAPLYSAEGGVSMRVVDLSIAVITLPLVICCGVSAVSAGRWLLLCAWPGALAIVASDEELVLRFGPFGERRFDAASIDTKYPFELSTDAEDGGFEAFLPEQQQFDTLLPRMRHAEFAEALERLLLKFGEGTEEELATAFRPIIERWRAARAGQTS